MTYTVSGGALNSAQLSDSIRFIWIFAAVPLRGCVKRVGLSKTAIFSTVTLYFFRSFTGKANNVI